MTVNIFVGLVAFLHSYFLLLEMFLWTKPLGRKVFGQSKEQAEATKVLAANQGLYNGFLVAGLIWSLVADNPELAFQLKVFFLGCVVAAGCYGAFSVDKKIFFVQALPALIGLVVLFLGGF
ncbi:MAG: hypothetical protein CME71_00640 [Halobacteriovorax sp.]|nr:hypothetical protein [Halobacteriovorax sp.]